MLLQVKDLCGEEDARAQGNGSDGVESGGEGWEAFGG